MFFDNPESQTRASDTKALGEPTTFAERTAAAFKAGQVQSNAFQDWQVEAGAYDDKIQAIKDATGTDLTEFHPIRRANTARDYADGLAVELGVGQPQEDPRTTFQTKLKELQDKHPEKAAIIQADKPISKRDTYWNRVDAAELATRRYMGAWGTGVLSDLIAGVGSQATDPLNLPTLAIGPSGAVKPTIMAVIQMGLKQGAANAAIEAIQQPGIQAYRAQMGDSSGFGHAMTDIGMAGAFGFGMDAGIRSIYRGAQKAAGRVAKVDPATGGVVGYESKAAAQDRATLEAAIKDQQVKAKAIADALRKADENPTDVAAIREAATLTGAIEDPSVRGAINELELAPKIESPIEGLDTGSAERAMIQNLRALLDPNEPGQVHIETAPKARTPDLSDTAEIPKGTDGNQHYRTLEIDGKPVRFQGFDSAQLGTDPAQFQFRSGRLADGSSGRLQGVSYDPALGGRVVVFERADGSLAVVDGHDRMSLVMREKDPVKMDGYLFREADGWTPDDVKALAAKKNIQEGTVDQMDVARMFRERPDLIDSTLPLGTKFIDDARALARLSDDAFGLVMDGRASEQFGRLVADLVPDKERHADVLRELAKADPKSEVAARQQIAALIQKPVDAESIGHMLGASVVPSHLVEPRQEVLSGVLDSLMNRDLDGLILSDVISRLAQKQGYVSDLLGQAAKAVGEGQPRQRAVDAFLRQIAAKVEESGVKGLDMDGPTRLAALAGSDSAVGKDMRRQLDQLGYYSKALEAANAWPQTKGTPEQVLTWLKKSGVKDAEIEATGVAKAFEGQKSLTRDDVVKHLTENRVGLNQANPQKTAKDIEAFSQHLENVLKDAKKEAPPRLVDDAMKDDTHTAVMREKYQGEANLAVLRSAERAAAIVDRAAQMQAYKAGFSIRSLFDPQMRTPGKIDAEPFDLSQVSVKSLTDLYLQRLGAERSGFTQAIEQATQAIETVYPGMTTRIAQALDAAPELKARISELMGTDPVQAKQLMQEALPPQIKPDIPQAVDTSKPLLYTDAYNARRAEIRAEIDRTIQMLPPDVRLRVEDSLVFNFDGTDARLDGLWDGYDRIVYASLSAGDPVRAVRHEVIHALRATKLLNDDEFRTLYAFADKLKLREAYAIDAQYLAKYTAAYGHRGADYVEMLLREETVANMFSDYSLNGRRFGDVEGGRWIDQVIDKVVSFMKTVRDGLHILGFKEVRDIFEEIESGRMARRPVKLPDGSEVAGTSLNDLLAAIRAYHGSPHDFDRFDLGKIDTGEGAQAFGHGLYFAEKEGVARYYRDALAPTNIGVKSDVFLDGKPINPKSFSDEWLRSGDAIFELKSYKSFDDFVKAHGDRHVGYVKEVRSLVDAGRLQWRDLPATRDWNVGGVRIADVVVDKVGRELILAGGNIDEAMRGLRARIDRLQSRIENASLFSGRARRAEIDRGNEHVRSEIDLAEKKMSMLRVLKASGENVTLPGRMYEVKINADSEHFLDLDKSLSQQSPHVSSVVDKVLSLLPSDRPVDPSKTTASKLFDMAGRGRAEEALREYGVPGAKYFDAGSRAAGEGSRNYVVFDDSLIEIVAKDGKPVKIQDVMARAEPGMATETPSIQEIRDMSDLAGACKP